MLAGNRLFLTGHRPQLVTRDIMWAEVVVVKQHWDVRKCKAVTAARHICRYFRHFYSFCIMLSFNQIDWCSKWEHLGIGGPEMFAGQILFQLANHLITAVEYTVPFCHWYDGNHLLAVHWGNGPRLPDWRTHSGTSSYTRQDSDWAFQSLCCSPRWVTGRSFTCIELLI